MNDDLIALFNVLHQRCGFEVVNKTETDNQIRLIHRVAKDGMPNWLMVMDKLLDVAAESPWNIDLSKQYFKRAGKLIYGWRIILQADDIHQYLPFVIQAVEETPRAQTIIDEQPLYGASAYRNTLKDGKGAQGVLRASLAVTR